MQNKTYKLDRGRDFGKWNDKTSKLMYFDSIPTAFNMIDTTNMHVADYGGGNGILKQHITCKKYTSIDIDCEKQPDITDDITIHKGNYDIIVLRYVLHYLSNEEVKRLIRHIQSFHNGYVLIIQFVNNGINLFDKQYVSKQVEKDSEKKYFRSKKQLFRLLKHTNIIDYNSIKYTVYPEFYKNRLGIDTNIKHNELIYNILIKCTQ